MQLKVRILSLNDIIKYKRTYFEILSHLTSAPLLDTAKITTIYEQATKNGSSFFGCFDSSEELVGVCTLLIEHKFTREGAIAGHIEEVITRPGYEGRGIGSYILQQVTTHAEQVGCYKVILDCDKSNVAFYQKNGYKMSGVYMRKSF